jgi:hypothetical protein
MQVIGLSQQKLAKPQKIRQAYGLSNRPSRNEYIGVAGTLPLNENNQLLPTVSHKVLTRNEPPLYEVN